MPRIKRVNGHLLSNKKMVKKSYMTRFTCSVLNYLFSGCFNKQYIPSVKIVSTSVEIVYYFVYIYDQPLRNPVKDNFTLELGNLVNHHMWTPLLMLNLPVVHFRNLVKFICILLGTSVYMEKLFILL